MLDICIIYILYNIFSINCIFWILSFIGEKYYKKDDFKHSEEVFECGFFSKNFIKFNFNYNFFFIALLLILYDVEIFLLTPFIFNWFYLNTSSFFLFFIFLIFILISFIFDWEIITLNWYI